MDQATQTAALNADLLVELLSHSSGPQKRESTAANLLPANGEHYAQVRYHLSCTGCKPLSCTGHTPCLMYRSHTISHVQVKHHFSCKGHTPCLMYRSHTISHVHIAKHLSCTGHAPSLMHRSRTISHAQVMHHLSCTSHTPSLMPTGFSQCATQNIYQPAQSVPSARYTIIHASALKICILVRVLAQFAPQQNTSTCSCCTDKPTFLRTCTWPTCLLT